MRVHRLRLDDLAAGRRRVVGPAAHHLGRVLRVRPGDELVAFDGGGREATGQVAEVDRDGVWIELGDPALARTEAPERVVLAVSLLKGDKLADVVRMGTELGVAAFHLVVARRCDARELSPARARRLASVAAEAARQCGRAVVPTVAPPVPAADLAWSGRALVADPTAEFAWRDVADLGATAVTLITGPEGGFEADEVAAFVARGAEAVRLGPRVLRAETAPVAAAAAWILAAER